MADNEGRINPLRFDTPIVTDLDKPTPYFIQQWNGQLRANATAAGLVAAVEALQVSVTALQNRQINTTAPLQGGGDLTADRTLSLAASGVTPGTYGDSFNVGQVTVDAFGRVTAAADVPIANGGGGAAQLVGSIRDDGTISDSTAAAFKGVIIEPYRDIIIHAIHIRGQSESGDDYSGFILELDGSNNITAVSATDSYTPDYTSTVTSICTYFATEVNLAAGVRYAVGVANQTDGDTSAFLAIEAATASETAELDAPVNTESGCYVAKMTPTTLDTVSTLPTHICISIVYSFPAVGPDALLMESGDFILMESGDKILLE